MGLVIAHCISSNHKLNTKKSTGSEIFGTSDYVLCNIWYIMFIHNEGYLNKYDKFLRTTKVPQGWR